MTSYSWSGSMPWPPSANRLTRAWPMRLKSGKIVARQIKSAEYREYTMRAGLSLMQYTPRPKLDGATSVRLTLWLVPPDNRRRDADNSIKATQDVLFRWLGVDDKAVGQLMVCRMPPEAPGRVSVTLTWDTPAISESGPNVE